MKKYFEYKEGDTYYLVKYFDYKERDTYYLKIDLIIRV